MNWLKAWWQKFLQSNLIGDDPLDDCSPMYVLVNARMILYRQHRWCTGSEARDINGFSVRSISPSAVRWSLAGAIQNAAHYANETPHRAMVAVYVQVDTGDIWQFNDTHTHAEVLAVLDKAIAAERTKQA